MAKSQTKKKKKSESPKQAPLPPPRRPWNIHRSLSTHAKRVRPTLAALNRPSQASTAAILEPQLLFKLDKIGRNPGELKQPTDVVVLPNNNVLVADYNNKRLQEFDRQGQSVKLFDHPKMKPKALAMTRDKYVAALDAKDRNIKTFTRGAELVCRFGSGYFHDPSSLAINSNDHYVIIDSYSNYEKKVFIYDPMTGIQTRLGFHDKVYLFSNPEGVAVTNSNRIIVTDAGHHCVFVFNSDGTFVRRIGQQGQGSGEFWYPKGVTVDRFDNIFVADCGNHRVCVLDEYGIYICDVLTKHHGLHFPININMNSDDILALVQNAEVYVFYLRRSEEIAPTTPPSDRIISQGVVANNPMELSLVKSNVNAEEMDIETCLMNEGMLI